MKHTKCRLIFILSILLAAVLLCGTVPAMAAGVSSYTAVINESTAVYSDAACTEQAGSLNEYDVVTVTGINDTIARIRRDGYTLYTDASALTAVSELAVPAKVNTTTFVFEDASITARSLSLKEGTQVNVIAVSGQWAMIEYKGRIGYTYKGYLDSVTDETAEDDEEVSDPFEAAQTEIVPAETAKASGVTVETVSASVSVTSLPVYKSASTRSAKLGTLRYGKDVTVYAYNSTWAYIGLDGKYGFCSLKGLKKNSAAAAPAPTPSVPDNVDASVSTKATVSAASVNIYASASTSSKKLGTLKSGIEVNVIKTSGKWAYIELDGRYGFCHISALTTSEIVDSTPSVVPSDTVVDGTAAAGTCTVITATAPVYSSASTNASSVTVSMGTTLNFYKHKSGWAQVAYNGKTAYIPTRYLSADNYAELKSEDSGSAVTTLNRALLKLGYLDDDDDSNYSAETVSAVRRLQSACGMKETGTADLATLRVLYGGNAPVSPLLSMTLSSGSKGENVTRIQTRLYSLGYLSRSSSIDGSYGNTTVNAVKLFQTAAGGNATGKADPATLKALYNPDAPSLPSSADAADAASQVASSGSSGSTATTPNMPNGLASTTTSYSSGMSNAKKLEYAIYVAQQQLGKRYVYGSAGTATFDCSGLTMYAFGKIGISLPHSAYSQGYNNNYTKLSTTSSMRRGDLIFFNTVSDSDMCDHVGIFLGNNYFIHASSGAGKVVVSSVASGYYNRVFSWGRRILA